MLSQAEKGGVQNTIQNCVTVLQNDPVLADPIRLNLLSERIDIVKPMGWQRSGPTLTDTDMMYILRRMEKYGLYSEKRVSAAIRIVANENHYHPMFQATLHRSTGQPESSCGMGNPCHL